MAKTRIGANAIFSGPQKGLTTIGSHSYAMSGSVTDAGSGSAATTCLDFTTGKGYIIADISYGSNSASGSQDEFIDIIINGQSVWATRYTNAEVSTSDQPLIILIPPLSHFVFKWGLTSDTRQMSVVLTGRVYDA